MLHYCLSIKLFRGVFGVLNGLRKRYDQNDIRYVEIIRMTRLFYIADKYESASDLNEYFRGIDFII